jgi:CBS domain-containing protein
MIRHPTVLGDTATVADVRDVLLDDHVHLVLVVDQDGALLTAIERADLDSLNASTPALAVGTLRHRTVLPEIAADDALALMRASRIRRLAVVDRVGTLLGLLCLKRNGTGFCSDDDVMSRR